MISAKYSVTENKSLLTIFFNSKVMRHMRIDCGEHLNFFQATYRLNCITLFKTDTGYKIFKVPKIKNLYQVNIKESIIGLVPFEINYFIYYLKKNGHIRVIFKQF